MKSLLLYQKNVLVNICYQPFEISDVFILKVAYLSDGFTHGLSNYQGIKAKCHHLKKLICKGTLRQVFVRVYRLGIQSVVLVFSTQLWELLPLSPSPWFNSLPLPCVHKYTRIHVYSVCGGTYGVLGLRQTRAIKSLYR
jgi:hypothetical protein